MTNETLKEETVTDQEQTQELEQVEKKTRKPRSTKSKVESEVQDQAQAQAQDDKEETKIGLGSVEQVLPTIGIYKLNEFTEIPKYGTSQSACFDIRVNLKGVETENTVKVYTKNNQAIVRKLQKDSQDKLFVEIRPGERMIAPTGAIYDIPEGYSLKVHPRSGTSLKQGINLINQEAVIDSDYVDELFLLLLNDSDSYVKIYHNERYAQGELQRIEQNVFVELKEAPKQKTERIGGVGHTGKD